MVFFVKLKMYIAQLINIQIYHYISFLIIHSILVLILLNHKYQFPIYSNKIWNNQWENYKIMMYNNLTDSLHLNCFGMRLSVTKGQCLWPLAINVDFALTQR